MGSDIPSTPLIALISATPVAIPPAVSSLERALRGVRVWNILDDRLLTDADEAGGLTPGLVARMERLIDHAVREGSDGVLLTCSMYGPVAQASVAGPLVLAADDAAFDAVIEDRHERVLVLASLPVALDDTVRRLSAHLAAHGRKVALTADVAHGAFDSANSGDADGLVHSLENASRPHVGAIDAVLLAQFSLAPAADRLSAILGVPVLSGPDAAAAAIAARLPSRP
jgi:hypothetical protein